MEQVVIIIGETVDEDGNRIPTQETERRPYTPPEMPLRYNDQEGFAERITTTDGSVVEILRYAVPQLTAYDMTMRLVGIDQGPGPGGGAMKKLVGDFSFERLTGNVIAIGQTILVNHQSGGAQGTTAQIASWVANAAPVGTEVVVTVQGVAGRTINWSLRAEYYSFTPQGK